MKIFCSLIVCFILVNCSKKFGPEGILKKYIENRFEQNPSKDELLSTLTGKMFAELDGLSDEDFQKFYTNVKYKKRKFKILRKRCTGNQCFITYYIAYLDYSESKKGVKTEVKKIAELSKIDDDWKIADVSNIKTYFEANDPITP